MKLLRKLRALFRKEKLDRDMAEEMRFHLEQRAADNIDEGMPPDEARYAAQRKFGHVGVIQERVRDQRGWVWLEQLFQDLRYACRMSIRSPGFTTIVLLLLALGIGANTAIFSLLDAVLWKMLPVAEPQTLVFLDRYSTATTPPTRKFCELSYPLMEALERRNPLLEGATTVQLSPATVNGDDGTAEPISTLIAADDFFSLLGIGASAGRLIQAGDTHAPERVAVLSHGYWQRRFGGSPVLGRSITINGVSHVIVGVAAREFFGVSPGEMFDVSVPMTRDAVAANISLPSDPRAPMLFWVMARLKPGVTSAQAASSLTASLRQIVREDGLAELTPERIALQRIEVRSASQGLDALRRKFSEPLLVLMALVGVVLLITCANLANLFLARAAARSREMAIRVSIGAGRARLWRQLVTESLVLALAGGALGLALAQVAIAMLVRLAGSGGRPVVLDVALDYRALAFTAAVAITTGLLFGLAPAWRAAGAGVTAIYGRVKRGSGALSLSSRILVAAQIALSLVLLAGAGLFVRSLQNLQNLDSGFRRNHLLLVSVNPPLAGIRGPQLADHYGRILERAAALPGVITVTFGRNAPFTNAGTMRPYAPAGYMPPDGRPIATPSEEVGPRYFETLGLRLIAGRDFRPSDDRNAPRVAAINEAAAREFFPGRNPIGQRLGPTEDRTLMEVIGVVADARHMDLRAAPQPTIYEAVQQSPQIRDTTFFVRTTGDPAALAPQLRQIIREANPAIPVMGVTTLDAIAARSLVQERLMANLASAFGLLALIVASAGVGGVLLFAVTRRTQEIGIRMALGATRGNVVRMVLREAGTLVAVGLAVGVPGAILLGHTAQTLLFELTPADPLVLGAASAVLVLAAFAATAWPARRAAKVDPMIALRAE